DLRRHISAGAARDLDEQGFLHLRCGARDERSATRLPGALDRDALLHCLIGESRAKAEGGLNSSAVADVRRGSENQTARSALRRPFPLGFRGGQFDDRGQQGSATGRSCYSMGVESYLSQEVVPWLLPVHSITPSRPTSSPSPRRRISPGLRSIASRCSSP